MTSNIPPDDLRSRSASLTRLKEIIAERCVLKAEDHWLVSPRGNSNKWQIDLRPAFLNAEALDILADLFWEHFKDHMPFQLGGLEIAAIPLITALMLKGHSLGLKVNSFIVRKERKRHGPGRTIEGQLTDDPIIIVDDLIHSGSSMEKVRVALVEFERRIDAAFVVVDFGSDNGKDWRKRHQVFLSSLFTIDDFGLELSPPSSRRLHGFRNVWTHQSPAPNHFEVVPKSAPAIADDKVLFGSDCGTFWALNVGSGDVVWTFQVSTRGRKGIWSRAAIDRDQVFFGAYDGNLYCLSLHDGSEVWRQGDADWIGSSPIISREDGLLWIGLEYARSTNHGGIAAFSTNDGQKVWELPLAGYAHGTAAYSRKHGVVAIGANDFNVYLVDAFTGVMRWQFATNGMVKEQPTFDETRDLLYVTGFDGFIRALDIHSGQQVWAISINNPIYSSPLIVGTKILVTATDKQLHLIDLVMQDCRSFYIGSKSVCSPVLIEESVYFGTNGGMILEFDAQREIIVGKHQLPDAVTNRLAWCPLNKLLFALTHMNQLFAFSREND